MIYINTKTIYGVETIDELDKADFPTVREYRVELRRLVSEYSMCGMTAYTSSKSTNEWRDR
jgi:hypothetical protein